MQAHTAQRRVSSRKYSILTKRIVFHKMKRELDNTFISSCRTDIFYVFIPPSETRRELHYSYVTYLTTEVVF